jgi:predicted permease
LSLTGGALGLAAGLAGVRVLLALYPGSNPFVLADTSVKIPRIGEHGEAVTADGRVLLFTVAVSVATGIAFGVLPALRASRSDVSESLKQAGGPGSTGSQQPRVRAALVASEIALALMLGIGAALLIRTSLALRAVDPGFDPHHVLTLRMSVSNTPFERRSGIDRLTREGVAQVRALPVVAAASTTCCVPFETVWQLPFTIAGAEAGRRGGMVGWTFVSPGYFDVLQVPLLRGRDFDDHDDSAGPGVVIINQAMARLYWRGADPLQDSILVGRGVRPDYDLDPIRRVIGIVGDVRDASVTRTPRPAMYVPVAQVPDGVTVLNVRLLPLTWIVRTRGEPHVAQAAIARELGLASGGLPVARVRSMDEVVAESTARAQFDMWLMTTFGGVALFLSAVGIYGLMAHAVQRRTAEIGIRLALGAAPQRLGWMIMRQALGVVLLGIAVGGIAAWNLTHVLAAFLFGVTTRDPIVFLLVPTLLTLVAIAAVVVPVRRATCISPVTALRYE